MPRATHVRGLPVAAVAGQRQAMHQAQVQAASVPAMVQLEVGAVAESLGADIVAINATLATVDERLSELESAI